MLTDYQREALEQAGLETAVLRLAAASNEAPHALMREYPYPHPMKRDVEAWLKAETRRQRFGRLSSGLSAVGSVLRQMPSMLRVGSA